MTTFEALNIIGRRVSYADFNLKDQLVEVIGDYYRYQLDGGHHPVEGQTYIVTGADGNILKLSARK